MSDDEGPKERPRRVSSAKQKKLELLEKMRSTIKGGKKNKYDIGELENVYDEVDEQEYSKRVVRRQEDDWIVDDGGCGYVEDGREIFDDDLDEESISKSKSTGSRKKRHRDLEDSNSKGNIQNMLINMPAKRKKESNVNLEEDDILGDIIGEIGTENTSPNVSSKSVSKAKTKELSAKEYINSFTTIKPKPVAKQLVLPKQVVKKEPQSPVDIKNTVIDVEQVGADKVEEKESTVVKIKEEPIDTYEVEEAFSENFSEEFDHVMEVEEKTLETASCKAVIKTEPVEEVANNAKTYENYFDANEWNKVSDENVEVQQNIIVDKSKLPLIKLEDGTEAMRFFYWDAHEEILTQPGTVFLFGKVFIESAKSYVSCCISVKNIERQIYLLPREKRFDLAKDQSTDDYITMADVYEEFNSKIASKFKIKLFKSRKIMKKYAFGRADIPLESEYLEVRYPANVPPLPSDLKGETFSCIFGTRTSFLELLLLERGIKGPGWIDITNPEPIAVPISWCKVEATCNNSNNLSLVKNNSLDIPPITIAVLKPQMVYNAKNKQSEIVAVGCLVNNSYLVEKPAPQRLFNQHFCVLSRPSDFSWPFDLKEALSGFKKTAVEKMESERSLLNFLLTKLFKIDADMIIGHDLSGYSIDIIMNRLAHHKIPNWSRFGRLKRSTIPHSKFKGHLEKIALTGRLMCDIKISAKELIRSRSYDLDTLCQNVLNFPEGKRLNLTDDEFKYAYCSGKTIVDAVWSLMSDATYILRIFIELNVLPLALQITNIAGNVMSRTLMGGRSERNEFLLLHAFHGKGYILPDKDFKKKETDDDLIKIELGIENTASKSSRKKPNYAGGLVLDPKIGFYDELILLMDFNSLYPSIIQEYNICFTTIPIYQVIMEESFVDEFNKYFPTDAPEMGILPTEIRKLVESRKEVKKLLKNPSISPELKMQYDIRQMALKLTANSMYGCLGFTHSRFYAKPLAALVTAKGREILMNTKKMVENYGYEVIYGDTDSIMINTKTKEFDQVYQIGKRIKTEVNKCYRQVELDIDGVFKFMLLLKKKKYAAVTLTKLPNGELVEKREMKGLDIVRRDWCQLSAEAGKFVLKQILSAQSGDDRIESIHGYLENIRCDLENNKVPLTLLTVTKQLTKAPENYADSKALPHVQVALRMNSASAKRFKQGDTISYIICNDGTNNGATQRAYHVEELKANPDLTIDINYYLSQQIHPVIARLCDPIEGTDAASIASCLGLDPSKYNRNLQDNGELDENEGLFGKKDVERFKDCERFVFKCLSENCKTDNIIEHPIRKMDNGVEILFLEHCVNSKCNVRPMDNIAAIQNTLQLKVRSYLNRCAKNMIACEDPVCNFKTNVVNPVFEGAYPLCLNCKQSTMHPELTSMQIYNQLSFFAHVFDITKASHRSTKYEPETVQAYKTIHTQMINILNKNKYSVVDLGLLFCDIFPPNKKKAPAS
ncbi:DNA polymerase alpha catalytic subunit [Cimex lectularius]|uniref:DNA polymerase n=1 Tax=Cimex lectularius TaxID=79782 RepID=A0A8I6S324_CIMLE|nr:DNA polymerase alpha catalytic subunit [Cimex lectularius]